MTAASVNFTCPSCGARHHVSAQAVGHKLRCPSCDELVDVNLSAPEPEPPVRPEKKWSEAETRYIDPAELSGGIEAPPVAAPPVVRAPLARVSAPAAPPPPPGAPPLPPPLLDSVPEKGPDTRLPARTKRTYQEAELDMTPMIDVTFQLLIFFMLTASFSVQKSLLIPKPTDDRPGTQVTPEPEESQDIVNVRVDAEGTYYVSGGGVGEDEVEVPSQPELIVKLRQARAPGLDGRVPNRMLVTAHGDARHDRVVSAIDAGNDVGMEEVDLKTTEGDE